MTIPHVRECVLICVTAGLAGELVDACVCDRTSHAIITLARTHIKELIHFGIVSAVRGAKQKQRRAMSMWLLACFLGG